jgi:hypothetical protein
MNDSVACCAHLRLKRVHTYWYGGFESDWWECESCNVRFMPSLSAEQKQTAHRLDPHIDIFMEFKNFHRALCERFGYAHDESDWRRDQISLIEHIARSAPDGEADG